MRKARTSVWLPPEDTAEQLGLVLLSYGQYRCAHCPQRYERHEESEFLDPDRETYHFDKLGLSPEEEKAQAGVSSVRLEGPPEPVGSPPPPPVAFSWETERPTPAPVPPRAPPVGATRKVNAIRCPKCGSTRAGRDGFFSDWGSDMMMCQDCRHLESVDEELDGGEWIVEVELGEHEALPARLPIEKS